MVEPFFIVGPTAVGKTSLAVEVAERAGAEIVSADAFQVYEGLDLLTAKTVFCGPAASIPFSHRHRAARASVQRGPVS